MKKRLVFVLAAAIIVVVAVSAFAAIESLTVEVADKKPFYVGVTYCGNSATEAEQLIDRVKNYTNLFVLDSGSLEDNIQASEQIGDYAVNSGLNVILCHNMGDKSVIPALLTAAQTLWGSHFLGYYYDDEPGGRMLDSIVHFSNSTTGAAITKQTGTIEITTGTDDNRIDTFFESSGIILINTWTTGGITIIQPGNGTGQAWPIHSQAQSSFIQTSTNYYPNGTVTYLTNNSTTLNLLELTYLPDGTVQDQNGMQVTDQGNISKFEPYQQLWNSGPLASYTTVSDMFVNYEQSMLSSLGNQSNVKLFTSDYGLDWFDYKAGYDVVLGELGWNQSVTQDIALTRGAADMQNKSWGTMLTWQTLSAPYLQSPSQMYDGMRQSYRSGAEYVVVFNYAPNDNGTGLLTDQHFDALQKFWTDVVQNPKETNNVKSTATLVLPSDYGWGMRNPSDNIWGIWQADNSSHQIWSNLQASLSKYGSKLDIVYDDPAYPTAGRYQHVILWNQTAV
jgi:hypothetical protein